MSQYLQQLPVHSQSSVLFTKMTHSQQTRHSQTCGTTDPEEGSAEWCPENKPLPGLLGRRAGAEAPWQHTAGPRGRLCPPITAMAKGMPSRHLSGWSKGSWWEAETLERAEREQERWEAACYDPASLPRPGEKVRSHKHRAGTCSVCRSVPTCGAFLHWRWHPRRPIGCQNPAPGN